MLCPGSTIKRSSAKAVEMVLEGCKTQAAEDRLIVQAYETSIGQRIFCESPPSAKKATIPTEILKRRILTRLLDRY
jgi:hypothetical protein